MATRKIPAELRRAPFTVGEALALGVSRRQLEGAAWRRLRQGVYVWAGLPEDPVILLAGMLRSLPPGSAFADETAAWLHGIEARWPERIHVTSPAAARVSARAGVRMRCAELAGDVVICRGLPTTSVVRTLFDVAQTHSLTEAVVRADAALHSEMVDLRELGARLAAEVGRKGSRRFRNVVRHAEPASESAMETRLRMLLVHAHLPRPEVQVDLRDGFGWFLGRADLYYPAARLAIEFDGGVHRDSLVEDNRRQNLLLNAGYRLLRYTTPDVLGRPQAVVAEVRAALRVDSARIPRRATA